MRPQAQQDIALGSMRSWSWANGAEVDDGRGGLSWEGPAKLPAIETNKFYNVGNYEKRNWSAQENQQKEKPTRTRLILLI